MVKPPEAFAATCCRAPSAVSFGTSTTIASLLAAPSGFAPEDRAAIVRRLALCRMSRASVRAMPRHVRTSLVRLTDAAATTDASDAVDRRRCMAAGLRLRLRCRPPASPPPPGGRSYTDVTANHHRRNALPPGQALGAGFASSSHEGKEIPRP